MFLKIKSLGWIIQLQGQFQFDNFFAHTTHYTIHFELYTLHSKAEEIHLLLTQSFVNESLTKNIVFPYSSFHAEHDGDIYFHKQHFLRKLEGF